MSNLPGQHSIRHHHYTTAPSLPQSRELGEAFPTPRRHDPTIASARGDPRIPYELANFIAGAAGGMTSSFLTAPLDVLKTRLQSDFYQSQLATARSARGIPPLHTLSFFRSSLLHVRETFQILVAVPRVEGPRALFKGLGPSLVGVVPARAINFGSYGTGKRLIAQKFFNGEETPVVHLFAAIQAGVITGTATCPIWVIKTRLQLDKNLAAQGKQGGRRYRGTIDCTLQTLRHEGIRGLYRGLGASYLGVTESTMQWVMYERLKSYLSAREEAQTARGHTTASEHAVNLTLKSSAAGMAKFVAALLTYPHEVIRTRLRQAPMADGRLRYTGIVQCFSTIVREEGVVALYGGLVPHMMRVVPSAAIMFGCYEAGMKAMGWDTKVTGKD